MSIDGGLTSEQLKRMEPLGEGFDHDDPKRKRRAVRSGAHR